MEGSIYLHIDMSCQRPLVVFFLQNHLNLVVPSPGGTVWLLPPVFPQLLYRSLLTARLIAARRFAMQLRKEVFVTLHLQFRKVFLILVTSPLG